MEEIGSGTSGGKDPEFIAEVDGGRWMEAGEYFSAGRKVLEAGTVEVVVVGRVILGSDRAVHGHGGGLAEWRNGGIGLPEAGIWTVAQGTRIGERGGKAYVRRFRERKRSRAYCAAISKDL